MNFDKFREYIPQILQQTLPGQVAHLKFAPPERISAMQNSNVESFSYRKAAILMLVYPKGAETHLALIVRNSYDGVHSSQIAFPGGKVETYDLSSEAAALRETFEEIGVSHERIKVIREFSKVYIPPSNFLVNPFLGFCEKELQFSLESREVAQLIELPLSQLLDENNIVSRKMKTSYSASTIVPSFQFRDHIVWGATAMMLSELKEVLKAVIFAKIS